MSQFVFAGTKANGWDSHGQSFVQVDGTFTGNCIEIFLSLHIVIQCGTIYLKKGEIFMSTITVRLNSEEARIYKEYAEFKNIPLSTLMKEALKEKIEDEIDLKAILAYEERLNNNEVEYVSFDEVKKRLEI